MRNRPRIAITTGDPAGIGPEISLKALTREEVWDVCQPVLIGSRAVLDATAVLIGRQLNFRLVPEGRAPSGSNAVRQVAVVEPSRTVLTEQFEMGQVSPACGDAAYAYIERGIELALAGDVDAVATAPINKEALNLAGHAYAGHTEIFTKLTGTGASCMMLLLGDMAVAHVTTHVALKDVSSLVTVERVSLVISLLNGALERFGVSSPRIAVAGLNPHAGEGGMFGTEDAAVIAPAVQRARSEGWSVEGPVPGDTVFVKLRAGRYDGVVAMYHDQGHIPVKLLGFNVDPSSGEWSSVQGVNVTLGLPIVRTSVDHGTAFDIAGRGIANEESMVDAVLSAARLARVDNAAASDRAGPSGTLR